MAGQRTTRVQEQQAVQANTEEMGRKAAVAFIRYVRYGREQDYREFRAFFPQQRQGVPVLQDDRFMRSFCAGMFSQRAGISEFLDAYSPDAQTLFGSRPTTFLLRSQTNDWLRFIDALHETDAAIRSGNTRSPEARNPAFARFVREQRARDSATIDAIEAGAALMRYVTGGKATDRDAFMRLYESNARPPERAERFRREAASDFCTQASTLPTVSSSVYAFLKMDPARIQLIPPPPDGISAFLRMTGGRMAEGDNLRSFAQAWSEVSDAAARHDERALGSAATRYGQEFVDAVRGRRRIAVTLGAVPQTVLPRAPSARGRRGSRP